MRVFVCAGSYLAKNEKINQEAALLGRMLADTGTTYVQGGYDQGLMGLTLMEFLKTSKDVEFFIPAFYFNNDAVHLAKLIGEEKFRASKVETETDRLVQIKKCDKVIVLPGGLGTLEELIYCNETARAKEHACDVVVVNIDGFYDGFFKQIEATMQQGLTNTSCIHFRVVNSVKEIEFLCDKKESHENKQNK